MTLKEEFSDLMGLCQEAAEGQASAKSRLIYEMNDFLEHLKQAFSTQEVEEIEVVFMIEMLRHQIVPPHASTDQPEEKVQPSRAVVSPQMQRFTGLVNDILSLMGPAPEGPLKKRRHRRSKDRWMRL